MVQWDGDGRDLQNARPAITDCIVPDNTSTQLSIMHPTNISVVIDCDHVALINMVRLN